MDTNAWKTSITMALCNLVSKRDPHPLVEVLILGSNGPSLLLAQNMGAGQPGLIGSEGRSPERKPAEAPQLKEKTPSSLSFSWRAAWVRKSLLA